MTPIAQMSLCSCQRRAHTIGFYLHRLAMAGLLENFGSHVTWCATSGCEHMELLFIHDTGETKISDQKVGIILGSSEQKVLGFKISMDNAMVVKVSHS